MRDPRARRTGLTAGALALAGLLMAGATPALADVKQGVDAWAAGDYATAVREWSGPAAQGDPDAQFNMAQAYRLGRGVEADPRQAEALYAAAAAQGHVKAADNYGLLLFQDGRREQAMPYVSAAADRGDPRAQYLVGVAHFNGDLVEKDWVRAYALLTLANGTGLPQARAALAQMDEYIPLDQREQAQVLAQRLDAQASANRSQQLAAVDLETGPVQTAMAPKPIPDEPQPPMVLPAPTAAPVTTVASSQAGADYTLPQTEPTTAPVMVASEVVQARAPSPTPAPAPAPVAAAPVAVSASAAMTGPWKLQLGAFGQPGNADRLIERLSGRPALGGARLVKEAAGRLTKVMAAGYASRAAAQQACTALKSGGQDCLVTQ
ncbi:MAG: SPOR domain-containing protein [Alphaproteobacteria bacterium]|nr:SPOR domain-containing protein [Alphaproteobacteria bacterium]